MTGELQTIESAPLTCRALVVPESYDADKKTVTFEVAAGSEILQINRCTGEEFYETLEVSNEAIRSERLDDGAPCLWDHQKWVIQDVLGAVEDWWIKDGSLFVRVMFTGAHDIGRIANEMVGEGTLRGVSLGYRVYRYLVEPGEPGEPGGLAKKTAVDWEPFEVTITPIKADKLTGVRSSREESSNQCLIETNSKDQESTMPPEETAETTTEEEQAQEASSESTQESETETTEETQAETEESTEEAASTSEEEASHEGERASLGTILTLCAEQNLDAQFAQDLNRRSLNLDGARAAIADELATRSQENNVTTRVNVTKDARTKRRENLENAICHKIDPDGVELTEGGRQYRSMRMLEIARHTLEQSGENTIGLDSMELATRAMHTTSDLPAVLGAFTRRSLRKAFDGGRRTFLGWARRTTLTDFRATERVALGGAPDLKKINEHGEVTFGKMADGKSMIQLESYGKAIAFTRRALINDDLSALDRLARAFGAAAGRLENSIVYALLTGDVNSHDGKALFHADHANTGTGAFGDAALNDGREKMRLQSDPYSEANEALNLVAKTLLIPTKWESAAKKLINSEILPGKTDDANPHYRSLDIIVEPLLNADSLTKFYLVADSNEVDTVEYGYLDGNDGVNLETYSGADIDGVKFKATHDFAAALIEHIGIYRGAGA